MRYWLAVALVLGLAYEGIGAPVRADIVEHKQSGLQGDTAAASRAAYALAQIVEDTAAAENDRLDAFRALKEVQGAQLSAEPFPVQALKSVTAIVCRKALLSQDHTPAFQLCVQNELLDEAWEFVHHAEKIWQDRHDARALCLVAQYLAELGQRNDALALLYDNAPGFRDPALRWSVTQAYIGSVLAANPIPDDATQHVTDLIVLSPLSANAAAFLPALKVLGDASRHDDVVHWGRLAACCPADPKAGLQALALVVESLKLQGRSEEAMVEAKRHFRCCWASELKSSVALLTKVIERPNMSAAETAHALTECLRYLEYGPDGQDGVSRSADDLVDPLGDVAELDTRNTEYALAQQLLPRCYEGNPRSIGYLFLLLGQFDTALAEMVSYYSSCSSGELVVDAVYAVATALKAQDGHALRANAYVAYQKYGAAGRDGVEGTADDLTDPLAGLPALTLPEKQMAYLQQRAEQAQNDYHGLREKGESYLAALKYDDGLAAMREAYVRRPLDIQAWRTAIQDIANALRAREGSAHVANEYLTYMRYGPDGEDGVAGTADDPRNPLEEGADTASEPPAAGGA